MIICFFLNFFLSFFFSSYFFYPPLPRHLLCNSCERIRNSLNPVPIAFCLNKKALATDLISNGKEQQVLNEDEARRGITFDELHGPNINAVLLPWHCGEDFNAALDLIARHTSLN